MRLTTDSMYSEFSVNATYTYVRVAPAPGMSERCLRQITERRDFFFFALRRDIPWFLAFATPFNRPEATTA